MTTEIKILDAGQKHMLRLVAKDSLADGWTPVSKQVLPLLAQIHMPQELIELEELEDGRGRVRLTDKGQAVLDAMAWLL